MLIQLPNGDWVKPEAVTAIQQEDIGCYLAVSHANGKSRWRCTPCVTQEAINDIAETINRACYKGRE